MAKFKKIDWSSKLVKEPSFILQKMMQNSKNSGGSGANDVNNQIDNEQKNQVKQAMEQEVNYNRQYIDELRNRLMIAKD